MAIVTLSEQSPVRSTFAADPDYRDLLALFGEAIPERRRGLSEAFGAGNLSRLQTLAHQLKGAGGGFGFPELSSHAAALEQACKAGELGSIAEALERTLAYLQRIAV